MRLKNYRNKKIQFKIENKHYETFEFGALSPYRKIAWQTLDMYIHNIRFFKTWLRNQTKKIVVLHLSSAKYCQRSSYSISGFIQVKTKAKSKFAVLSVGTLTQKRTQISFFDQISCENCNFLHIKSYVKSRIIIRSSVWQNDERSVKTRSLSQHTNRFVRIFNLFWV